MHIYKFDIRDRLHQDEAHRQIMITFAESEEEARQKIVNYFKYNKLSSTVKIYEVHECGEIVNANEEALKFKDVFDLKVPLVVKLQREKESD